MGQPGQAGTPGEKGERVGGGRCIRQREKETETEIPKQAVCFSKHILLVNFAIRVINANSILNKKFELLN